MALPSAPERYYGVRPAILDPCAGEGEALCGLVEAWENESPGWRWDVHGYELEATRAKTLGERLGTGSYKPAQADAFCLEWRGKATVVYANAPYDTHPVHGRLEHAFLLRFTDALHAGNGYLLFLIPAYALAASASHLSEQFGDIRCYRLPEPEFLVYKQVLVVARRLEEPLPPNDTAELIRAWASDPSLLPELEERCSSPLVMRFASHYGFDATVREVDVAAAAAGFAAWEGTPAAVEQSIDGILGVRVDTILPVKPAHIALALAAGHFNGHELAPNDPDLHPPILAKGVFRREDVVVDEKRDKEGETTAYVKVERPRLDLSILDLETYRYHRLEAGVTPSRSRNLADWTAADVMQNYDGGLAELLRKQFPPLHDPTNPDHTIALPALARAPFRSQSHAIQAALKMLALGQQPIFDAEVGTGKSTMTVYIAMALSPAWHAQTSAELARLGFGKVPLVKKTLIVCPPHLVATWEKEIRASVPDARIVEVRGMRDLERDGEWYILSRETAKLGPSIVGIAGRCPGCGAPVKDSAEVNATKRLRCQDRHRAPSRARDPKTGRVRNRLAQMAETLAAALRPVRGGAEVVRACLPRRLASWTTKHDGEIRKELAVDVLGELLQLLSVPLNERGMSEWELAECIENMALGLGVAAEIADAVEERKAGLGYAAEATLRTLRTEPAEDEAPEDRLLTVVEKLRALGKWRKSGPCGEPLFGCKPPRRYPLARYILRRCRGMFSLAVLDEGHEFQHGGSAQSKAAARVTALPGVPTMLLSGSLCNGYASSVFNSLWMLSERFRREFEREEKARFSRMYGYQKVLVDAEKEERKVDARFGSQSDRELEGRTVIGEAAGATPALILRHLLGACVVLHKADLEQDLPPMTETPVALEPETPDDEAMLAEYKRLQETLIKQIAADRFEPELAGRLLGALVDLMSYPDRCTDDLPPYEITYPESCGGGSIAVAKMFPRSWRTRKERYLLATLRERLRRGERCIVFVTHTQTGLAERVLRLIRNDITLDAAYMDVKKVGTKKRSAWIEEQVRKGTRVLVCNPTSVKTGLNGLVAFSTAIWQEIDYSAQTWRQANGRLHRPGQEHDVTILLPYHAGTAQEIAVELVAAKVGASEQVDGLSLESALSAAGASSDDGAAAALAIGEQVYRKLAGTRA